MSLLLILLFVEFIVDFIVRHPGDGPPTGILGCRLKRWEVGGFSVDFLVRHPDDGAPTGNPGVQA